VVMKDQALTLRTLLPSCLQAHPFPGTAAFGFSLPHPLGKLVYFALGVTLTISRFLASACDTLPYARQSR